MIIVNLTGGLGNQMFQYAFGKIQSNESGIPLKIHFTNALFCTDREYSLDCFRINTPIATAKDLARTGFPQSNLGRIIYRLAKELGISELIYSRIVTERNYLKKLLKFNMRKDYYFEGYWQGEKYIGKNAVEILKTFSFSKKISSDIVAIREKINNTNSVAIHVRRGDYVTNPQVRKVFKPCGEDYYKRSIKYLNIKIKSPVYFIFSDDISWVENHIKTNRPTFYINNNKPWEDMFLMSQCKHNIIANSSFSWWSAWLNQNKNKTVIAPVNWTSKSKSKELKILPYGWITISNRLK